MLHNTVLFTVGIVTQIRLRILFCFFGSVLSSHHGISELAFLILQRDFSSLANRE
jgi:hypothetical protein